MEGNDRFFPEAARLLVWRPTGWTDQEAREVVLAAAGILELVRLHGEIDHVDGRLAQAVLVTLAEDRRIDLAALLRRPT